MERLPYIDEHVRTVDTGRDRLWAALMSNWGGPPRGFHIDEAIAPSRLSLSGRHPFSRYALVFDLEESDLGRTELRARTWAEFPGLHGRLYRALVISSGVHRLAVRRLLSRIAAQV